MPGRCRKKKSERIGAAGDGEENAADCPATSVSRRDEAVQSVDKRPIGGRKGGRRDRGSSFSAGSRQGFGLPADQQLAAFCSSRSLRRTLSLICG